VKYLEMALLHKHSLSLEEIPIFHANYVGLLVKFNLFVKCAHSCSSPYITELRVKKTSLE